MKYVCQFCSELVDEAYAVDSDGYYCSHECYHHNYVEEEKEAERKRLEKIEILKNTNYPDPPHIIGYDGKPIRKGLFRRHRDG